jgi:hypothetical protein
MNDDINLNIINRDKTNNIYQRVSNTNPVTKTTVAMQTTDQLNVVSLKFPNWYTFHVISFKRTQTKPFNKVPLYENR